MIAEWAQYLAGLLIVIAALFSSLAALGMLRFPDIYTRLHAASKAGALGAGLSFLAIAVAALDASVATRAIFGLCFVLATSPVIAHLLARAALHSGTSPAKTTNITDRYGSR